MKKFLLGLLLALASLSASADYIATFGPDVVTARTGTACPATVLQHVKPEFHDRLRRADALISGKPFVGCWLQEGDVVFLVWEDGDTNFVPAGAFRELKTV